MCISGPSRAPVLPSRFLKQQRWLQTISQPTLTSRTGGLRYGIGNIFPTGIMVGLCNSNVLQAILRDTLQFGDTIEVRVPPSSRSKGRGNKGGPGSRDKAPWPCRREQRHSKSACYASYWLVARPFGIRCDKVYLLWRVNVHDMRKMPPMIQSNRVDTDSHTSRFAAVFSGDVSSPQVNVPRD